MQKEKMQALTTAQRAKVRKLEREYEATVSPIRRAHWGRYEEVKKELFVTLEISARVEQLGDEYYPKIEEIKKQISELNQKWTDLSSEWSDKRTAIQAEAYSEAYKDPQVIVTSKMWETVKTEHEQKMAELLASFEKVEA